MVFADSGDVPPAIAEGHQSGSGIAEMRHSSIASSAVTCDSRASQYFIAGFLEVYRSSNRFLRCFTLPVEAVF
ncbi:MAG: hypothetical protein RLO18_27415, partial [Gimesia chilikensis]